MIPSSECLYCSYPLLCQIRQGKPYWFCKRCRRDIPFGTSRRLTETTSESEYSFEKTGTIAQSQPLKQSPQTNDIQHDREIQEQIIQSQEEQKN